ncbi:c-type cytochrome [Vibrio sp. HN007]|uniref:c-type cytochrome n=1 Tax=Vibrio iocasae TaxID=3098914 RepID=UPI0035D51492
MILKQLFAISFTLVSTLASAGETNQYQQGEHLFRTAGGYGCSTCHGMFAQGGGNVGGNIRGATLSDINARLDNEPTMQLLSAALSAENREDLAFYLTEMGKLTLIEWTIEDKANETNISLKSGTNSQLVIFNKKLEPVSLVLTGIAPEKTITIQPYETKAFDWLASKGDFQLAHQQNTINISVK